MELMGGFGRGETAGADIGDAVAIGIGFSGDGTMGEISAETVGAAEAGTFAEQDQRDSRAEDFADFILQRDAGVPRDDERSKAPLVGAKAREQGCSLYFFFSVPNVCAQ